MDTLGESKYEPVLTYGSGPIERLFAILVKFFKNVTVEPVAFFYALGFSITTIVTPNLYIEKICTVSNSLVCRVVLNPLHMYYLQFACILHTYRL